jgi:hypothetical protein
MTKSYSSYLFRWWHLESDRQRIEIVHIQSGERTLQETLSDALTWLEARSAGDTSEPHPPSIPPAQPPGLPKLNGTDGV